MKKTDLEKNKALKLANALKHDAAASAGGAPSATTQPVDRREQRRIDQSLGLAPFACKLNVDLIKALQDRAAGHPGGLNALVEELLVHALENPPASSPHAD
jgi:hypothetical protein